MAGDDGNAATPNNTPQFRRSVSNNSTASAAAATSAVVRPGKPKFARRRQSSSTSSSSSSLSCKTMQIFQIVGTLIFVFILLVNLQFSMQSHESITPSHHETLRLQGWDVSQFVMSYARKASVAENSKPQPTTRVRQITLSVGEEEEEEVVRVLKEDDDDDDNNGAAAAAAADGALDGGDIILSDLPRHHKNQTLVAELTSIFRQPAPWRKSQVLPAWMKEYIAWHQEKRAAMNAANWDKNGEFRFLIIRCIREDVKCGGTADRLKPLPFFMYVAKQMKRILLIWWEKPAPLEEFLLPPPDGLDWRVPPYIRNSKKHQETLRTPRAHMYGSQAAQAVLGYVEPTKDDPHPHKTALLSRIRFSTETIITFLFQSHGHGSYEYNDLRVQYPYFVKKLNETVQPLNLARSDEEVEASYEDVFRDCWYSAFVPIPSIQHRIADEMIELGLRRNQYQAVHIRSRYHAKATGGLLRNLCKNALHCIFQAAADKALRTPIFVSADHPSAVWATLRYSLRLNLDQVTARNRKAILSLTESEAMAETSTLHMDRGTNILGRKPHEWTANQYEAKDFYDTFVDLYLLAQADCIAFNVGNYGKWANLISENRHCEISHMKMKCPRPVVKMQQ